MLKNDERMNDISNEISNAERIHETLAKSLKLKNCKKRSQMIEKFVWTIKEIILTIASQHSFQDLRQNMTLQEPPTKINFYHSSDPEYGCFSNFSPHPIELENKIWPTVEHWFQVQIFYCLKCSLSFFFGDLHPSYLSTGQEIWRNSIWRKDSNLRFA